MKKLFISLLLGVASMYLVACTADDSTVVDNETVGTNDVTVSDNTTPTSIEIQDGSTVVFSLSSGETPTYSVPENHFNTTSDFAQTLTDNYGVSDLTLHNTLFTGSSVTLFGSEQAINCMAFSDLEQALLKLGYVDTSTIQYSTAYTYMKTGNLSPGEFEENYELNELDSITCDSITYRVFEVSYETPTTLTDPSTNEEITTSVKTECLQVYSDTDDTVEIIIYTGDYNRDTAVTLLNQFLGI